MTIAELVARLAASTEALCRDLFPAGRRDGQEWRIGGVDGEPGRSMAVHLSGRKAGVWADFSTGEAGDALDLVAAAVCGGNKKDAVRWSRRWLGIEGERPDVSERARRAHERAAAAAARPKEPAEQDNEHVGAAFRLFLSAQEKLRGTPADLYLKARGLDLEILGRQPHSLRFHPACWNVELDRKMPALLAAITNPDGTFAAVQRIYLAPRADGVWWKAALEEPKKTLGRYRGGCTRLWRGASGKALKDAPAGDRFAITEGYENGIAAAIAMPELRVLVAVSLRNLAAIELPDTLTDGIVIADNDAGEKERALLQQAAHRLVEQGRRIRIARAPEGLKDVNDVLLGKNTGAAA